MSEMEVELPHHPQNRPLQLVAEITPSFDDVRERVGDYFRSFLGGMFFGGATDTFNK